MAQTVPAFTIRSTSGVNLCYGPPSYKPVELFATETKKECHVMIFSQDGQYFAWASNTTLTLVACKDWTVVGEINHPRITNMAFSPKSTYLMVWQPFAVSNENKQGSPNLCIYLTKTLELFKNFVHKKQSNWMPQWTSEENLCSKMVNNDVVFYENQNFEKIVTRINFAKIEAYSLAPGRKPHHVLCYTAGSKGQPSFCRLFKYPKLDGQQALANKGFFQADSVDFHWNAKGTSALLVTCTDIDKTGASYYGKQTLHYIAVNGNTAMITFNKEGPLYTVAWSPNGTEFCAVYGFMPSHATIYNLKCEPVFETGASARNSIYYNPFGNILLLGGFGNLRGHVEIWDMKARKLINEIEIPDTTFLQWSPDGTHFITATTAPRLRIGNGYKIWHYSGVPLHHQLSEKGTELYEVCWQNCPPDAFKEPVISNEHVTGIKISEPQVSKQAYRPPAVRFRMASSNQSQNSADSNQGSLSKAALKQKKKREARKNKKQENADDSDGNEAQEVTVKMEQPQKSNTTIADFLTGDPEVDKKIKNIKRKLDAISKLKEQQASGKAMEVNQVAKIKTEDDLLKELKSLQLGTS